MKSSVFALILSVGSGDAFAANSNFRCITNKVVADAGIGHTDKYAAIDLEVKDEGNVGLFNGEFISVKPLEVNENGEIYGNKKTASGAVIHDQLELVANLSIKTKLFLRMNSTGENGGLSRGYIESIWGTKKIFWRGDSGIYEFSYRDHSNSDCTKI